jgi:flagellar motor switch protein FliM
MAVRQGPSTTVEELPVGRAGVREAAFRPFTFDRLEKLPRSHVQLLNRLDRLFPDGLLSGELGAPVREALHRVFDEDVQLWLDYVHLVPPKALAKLVPEPTFLAVLAPSPHGSRGLVEMELALAHSLVDMMLGAVGESAMARPLTDIERGVISYVLLEAFRALSPPSDCSGRGRLRVEQVVDSLKDGQQVLGDAAQVAVVEFKVFIGTAAGYLRLMLPEAALDAAAAAPDLSLERQERRRTRLRGHAGRLAGVRVWLRAEIGRGELTWDDLIGLRAGDVFIADELAMRPDRGEPGQATLRIGLGRAGRAVASVQVVGGRYQATVERFELGPEPRAQRPAESELPASLAPPAVDSSGTERGSIFGDAECKTESHAPNSLKKDGTMADGEGRKVQGAELLNDVPLQLVVELARVAITAQEVLELHVGKVLDLGRGPGEPVELSINGRVVARGELVEIDGQLGVRIASLSE